MTPRALARLDTPDALDRWEVVNDGVMGGVSRGRMEFTSAGTAVFSGEVSLENNGGFASVRTVPADYAVAESTAVALRVKGDGRRYRFRLRTDDASDGIAYQAGFDTRADEWMDVVLRFTDFAPSFRGRVPADAPPLDPGRIRRLGFMIADQQAGPFRLEIERVESNG